MNQFKNITTFLFDMDGVLTDGSVLVLENGLQARRMNIKDGYALQLAIKRGYRVAVISGATNAPVIDRLNKLGIKDVQMGVEHKDVFIKEYQHQHQLKREEILFMGDDMPDIAAMKMAGLATCPADAIGEIKELAAYISPNKGGEGCVRDVIEQVMKANGNWYHEPGVASK